MTDENAELTRGKRRRVVLADASQPVTVLRTINELEQQTSIGEVLVRNLIRAQLRAAAGLGALVLLLFASVPLIGVLVPAFSAATFVGVPLPWLVLGVLPFPLFFVVGTIFNRLAERNERDFVHMVEN